MLVMLAACWSSAAAGWPGSDEEMWADGYVVILGSGSSFKAVEKSARLAARKCHLRYDRMDRSFNNPDPGWYGRMARDGERDARGDVKPFVSVEYSTVYGLKKQFVVVGAVTYTLAEAKRELARHRAAVPDAYIKKFRQYMGCRS